jgi:hypothetical protein
MAPNGPPVKFGGECSARLGDVESCAARAAGIWDADHEFETERETLSARGIISLAADILRARRGMFAVHRWWWGVERRFHMAFSNDEIGGTWA